MPLDSKQHVRETSEYVRTNRFALQTSCEAEHEVLINRHCEMIRPEVRQPFDEWTISTDGWAEPRAGLSYVDGLINLPDLRKGGDGIRLIGRVRGVR